jgi:hypothetical protein
MLYLPSLTYEEFKRLLSDLEDFEKFAQDRMKRARDIQVDIIRHKKEEHIRRQREACDIARMEAVKRYKANLQGLRNRLTPPAPPADDAR